MAIAKFKVTDPDANNSFRYSVDDPRFEVVDGILRMKSGQFLRSSVASTFTVNVCREDAADPTLRLSKAFTFNVQANANPWQNPINRLDTNNDGRITPLDVLVILNLLNDVKYPIVEGSRIASTRPSSSAMPYYDTNADGLVTSLDALIVTNYLNGLLLQLGTGTTTTSFAALSASDEVPDPVSVLETPLYLPANSAQPLWSIHGMVKTSLMN